LICFGLEIVFVLIESARLVVLSRGAYGYGLMTRSRFLANVIGNVLPGLGAGDVVRVFIIDRVKPGNKAGILVLLLGNRLYGVIPLVALGFVALVQPVGARLIARLGSSVAVVVALGVLALIAPLLMRWAPARRVAEWSLARLPRRMAPIADRMHAAILD